MKIHSKARALSSIGLQFDHQKYQKKVLLGSSDFAVCMLGDCFMLFFIYDRKNYTH